MIQWRSIATQFGLILFLILAGATATFSLYAYQQSTQKLLTQAKNEISEENLLLSYAISDHVLYQRYFKLWDFMEQLTEQKNQNIHKSHSIISFAVTDANRHILAHNNPVQHPLLSELPLPPKELIIDKQSITSTTPIQHPDNHKNIGWLIVVHDISYIQEEINSLRQNISIGLIIALILSLLIAITVQYWISRPLTQIIRLARQVGQGNLKNIPQQILPYEIEMLSESLIEADHAIVSSRREIEKIKKVIEQADEAIIITDVAGIVEYVNPAFERLSGYSKEESIGQPPSIIKSGKQSDKFYKQLWSNILSGQTYYADFINRRKDGELYTVAQTIFPFFNESGEIEGFAGLQRDITQSKKIADKLQHADRVESLGVLAGGIAHDFNNILTSIMGNASLAKMQVESSHPVFEHLDSIESASLSAADLCRQMLAYSGKGQFVIRAINISRKIEKMGQLINISVSKIITLKYQLTDELPLIEADVAQVQQVILNLLTNASEAIGEESGIISVSTGIMEASNEYLKSSYCEPNIQAGRFVFLEVSDTGCGMTAEVQKKIFDSFFTTKFTGRGLGMSAMLGIINAHKGAMRIYSKPNSGTTIRVLFPVAEKQQTDSLQKELNIETQNHGTILLIDDENNVREITAAMLEQMGADVIKAVGGENGIHLYQQYQHDIDLVLLDLTMPDMNGHDCFRELQRINPNVKVIITSGYSEQESMQRFDGKYPNGFIQKPFTPEQLIKTFSKVISSPTNV